MGSDPTALALRTSFNLMGKKAVSLYDWEVLKRVHSITFQTNVTSYALPEDYDRLIPNTGWNTTNDTFVFAGMTQADWAQRKYGNTSFFENDSFAIFGWVDSQINFYTRAQEIPAGETIVFHYLSNAWLRPKSWSPSTFVQSQELLWSNGLVYRALSPGTTSNSAPTHPSGDFANGTTTLRFVSNYGHDVIKNDNDVPHLDDLLLTYMTIADFGEAEGFDVTMYKQEAQARLESLKNDASGASVIRQFRRNHRPANIPDRGYGEFI
jgi:hypothetical protein